MNDVRSSSSLCQLLDKLGYKLMERGGEGRGAGRQGGGNEGRSGRGQDEERWAGSVG